MPSCSFGAGASLNSTALAWPKKSRTSLKQSGYEHTVLYTVRSGD